MKELRFQQKPFEWNYEGLAPLLLRDVLRTRRGISLSLAILFSGVARRLGLCLLPLPVSPAGGWSSPHPGVHALGLGCQIWLEMSRGVFDILEAHREVNDY